MRCGRGASSARAPVVSRTEPVQHTDSPFAHSQLVTYIKWRVQSVDGGHRVQLYCDWAQVEGVGTSQPGAYLDVPLLIKTYT